MTLTDHKVTAAQIAARHVQAQGDELTGAPATNKAVFDNLPEHIAEKHNDMIDALPNEFAPADVDLDIQELFKPLIAPLSVSLTGFVEGSYLLYGEFYDEIRVFVKISKTTAMTGAVGTLPAGYRPTEAQTLTAYDTDGVVVSGIAVTIGTDGAVAVTGEVDANDIILASYKGE